MEHVLQGRTGAPVRGETAVENVLLRGHA